MLNSKGAVKINFLDCAYEILKKSDTPLHYTEITNRALAANILDTKGQTPEATMGSRLYTDTKQPNSRFRRVKRGVFGLVETQSPGIAQRITTLNEQTRSDLRQRLFKMPPDRFEVLISQLLTALGFEEETIEVTSYSNDGGIDVRGILNAAGITKINAAVQAKRWKRNIQAPAIQALRGSLTVHEQGIFITTSKFSKGAIAEAEAPGKTPVSLIDGDKLVTLLIRHEIGVVNERHTLHTLDEAWWDDVAGADESLPEPMPQTIVETSPVTYPLPIWAKTKKAHFQAELLDINGRTCYNGVEYQSPSGAGQVASGWKSCNGWTFWYYQHPETKEHRTINILRQGLD
ncbi:MAG: restriction endonuclease [Anaerolineales bacterium]|nr:restriction endonuclease [Anaerolineales bacterium]